MGTVEAKEIDWKTIFPEPFVVLILGQRGGGKTALGHLLLEIFSEQGKRRKAYIVGFPAHKRHLLPDWITPLDDLVFPEDSVVLLHEAHFYLHARRSMSEGNIEIDKLVTISRHKNVDIIVGTQQSFRLDRNIVAEVDGIIFRLPELMQEKFERPEVRWITQMAKKAFAPYIKEHKVVDENGKVVGVYREVSPEVVKKAFIFSKNYVGMYPHDIPLPSYWSEEISRAYGELKSQEERMLEMADDEEEKKIIDAITKKPEIREILERMVQWEEEHEGSEFYKLGFEYDEVDAPPQTLVWLYNRGILKRVYSSNKHKGYLLRNRDAVKRVLSKLG